MRVARYHNIFDEKGVGITAERKRPLCYKNKAKMAEKLRFGETASRPVPFSRRVYRSYHQVYAFNFIGPVNIGSEEMVTINQLVQNVSSIAEKNIKVKHVDGPTGVRGRNSNNDLFFENVGWKVSQPLVEGLTKTYAWINSSQAAIGELT